MALIFRWLIRLASALILFGVGCFGLAYYFASRSLPDYNADFEIAGITTPVEIVRDNANVPHIFGGNDADVYFALGFAHAQDRMWQMTMLRRTAQGRLSELFGPATLDADELVKRLDLYGAAVTSAEVQDPTAKVALNAYAAGVNAWLNEVNSGSRGRGAPEMWLFNHGISPWQPADSIAIMKLMALQSSSSVASEVLRARMSLVLSPERLRDILPDAPGTGIATLPAYASLVTDVPRYAANTSPADNPLMPTSSPDLAGASNAWAAGISRSAAGATLLANDPHVNLTAPSIYYLARMELKSGGVIGATIPGMPVVLSGRTENLGWGITASYLDDQDVFIEQVNPDDSTQYRTSSGWTDFTTRERLISVKGSTPITLQLRWTGNGPVLPGHLLNLGTVTPPGYVTAIAWTALDPADKSMSAALRLPEATTVDHAIDAMADYVAPAQNLVLADRNRIAMKSIGAFPSRELNHQSQGRLPTYGYLSQNQWQGILPYDQNPEFTDPEGGILGNTNNKIVNRPFPNHMSFDWGDTQRIHRWKRLMQSRQVHTRESFIEAQLDTVSPTARALLPLVGADLWFTGDPAADGTPERRRQQALELLAAWNGEMNEHLPEPLIYAAWMRALQDRLTRDELGQLTQLFTHPDPVFIERVFRNTDGAGVWCDVIQSAPVETCTDIARQALDDALIWIGETYGTTLTSLRWGDAHQAMIDHPTLGRMPVLNWFVNIRQSTSGGDHTLQRARTAGTGANPFRSVHAAGYRGVYDFADPDSSVFITSTGQSGHPLSRYYDNLGEMWRRGEYIPMSLDPALARAAAVGITTMLPKPK